MYRNVMQVSFYFFLYSVDTDIYVDSLASYCGVANIVFIIRLAEPIDLS